MSETLSKWVLLKTFLELTNTENTENFCYSDELKNKKKIMVVIIA